MLGLAEENEAVMDSIMDLIQPRSSSTLFHHRSKVLSHMGSIATSIGTNDGSGTSGGITTANLKDLINAMRQAPSATSASGTAINTTESKIEKHWSVNLNTLLLFNLSSKVDELPAIYGAIAAGNRN